MSIIIEKYEEFTPDIANQTIGHLYPEPITATEIRTLGEGAGLMSSIARGHLTFASGKEETVIVKCVARTDNRELSKGLNFYQNELNFYMHLVEEAPMPAPKCLYAAIEPSTQDFLLVLEDIAGETVGDQLVACTEAQLQAAFRRAGELHGTFWGRTGEFDWLNYQVDMKTTLFRRDAILKPGIESTINQFGEYFTGHRAETLHKITEQYIDLFLSGLGGEPTIIHGDYRTDNVFLVEKDGEADIIAFDWQNATGANGTHDIAYFCSQSADADLHGDAQMRALRLYHETLIDYGVKNFSFDECLERYRYNLLIWIITPIAICGTLDQGNERGAMLGKTILGRNFSAIEAMDCEALLK
ncbi:MAG: phosphotransferase [Pseudomonadota bacterium]